MISEKRLKYINNFVENLHKSFDIPRQLADGVEELSAEIRSQRRQIKILKDSKFFYQIRCEELERNKKLFPEPYLNMVCNILANGKIEP
jgi:hypothetical protein